MTADVTATVQERLTSDMLTDEPSKDDADTKDLENVQAVAPSPSPVEAIISDIRSAIDQLQPIAGATQAAGWHASLRTVRDEAARKPEVLVAFVGATGAGKSSLINALLGDHIVPTSGVKSCTSTPILVSYHDHDQVRAKIEFVSTESWREEVRLFLEALVEAGGMPAKLADDAQEAWHRIRVVYPKLTPQTLHRMTAEQVLASDANTAAKLGTTIAFSSAPAFFNQELQHYTRARNSKDDGGDLWPLIAQIAISCRAPVLASGIALVDLPGVLDSNAARAAVAGEYMKRCHNVFVVAPIKRAATDQVARDLMGDAFKTQLMMDGKYSANSVTLIATCNDDILCSEIISEFSLEAVSGWARLQNQLKTVDAQINDASTELEDLQNQMRHLNPSEMALDDPAQSHSGTNKTLKRSSDAVVTGRSPTKKQKIDGIIVAAGPIDPALLQVQCTGNPHADVTFSNKMLTVTTRASLASAIAAKETEVSALICTSNDLNQDCTKFCAKTRSDWTRNELQEQFREGRLALCGADDSSEPAEDEDFINVFPVSARDYLKLLGKSPLDGHTPLTFQTAEETGIPAVIEFCRNVGQKGSRMAKHRQAMKLSAMVMQLQSYVSKKSCIAYEEHSRPEDAPDDIASQGLKSVTPHRIAASLRHISDTTSSEMMHRVLFPQMVAAPAEAAPTVSAHIEKAVKAVKHWRTLKAILRRDGSWKEHNWNGQAVAAMTVHFAESWRRELACRCLRDNTSAILKSIDALDASSPPDSQFRIAKYKANVLAQAKSCSQRATDKCRTMIRSRQAVISRTMDTKFTAQMRATYQRASALTGLGVMAQSMSLVCQAMDDKCLEILTSIVNESIDALRSAAQEALCEYHNSLQELAELVESLLLPILVMKDEMSDGPLQEDLAMVMAKLEAINKAIKSYEDGEQQL